MDNRPNIKNKQGQALRPSADGSGQALRLRSGQAGQALRLRSGQAMILTVLVLSSTILSLSAIGGYLMLVRLRTSSDIMSTTRAIYAADSGLECETYNQLINPVAVNGFCADNGRNVFTDGDASYTVEYVSGPPAYILSTGNFRNSNRSLRLDF